MCQILLKSVLPIVLRLREVGQRRSSIDAVFQEVSYVSYLFLRFYWSFKNVWSLKNIGNNRKQVGHVGHLEVKNIPKAFIQGVLGECPTYENMILKIGHSGNNVCKFLQVRTYGLIRYLSCFSIIPLFFVKISGSSKPFEIACSKALFIVECNRLPINVKCMPDKLDVNSAPDRRWSAQESKMAIVAIASGFSPSRMDSIMWSLFSKVQKVTRSNTVLSAIPAHFCVSSFPEEITASHSLGVKIL